MAQQQPNSGPGRLTVEAVRSHKTTHSQSVGPPGKRHRPVAEAATCNNKQHSQETNFHAAGGIRTRSPIKRAPGHRPLPLTVRPLGQAKTVLVKTSTFYYKNNICLYKVLHVSTPKRHHIRGYKNFLRSTLMACRKTFMQQCDCSRYSCEREIALTEMTITGTRIPPFFLITRAW